jgi:hypothetical protein
MFEQFVGTLPSSDLLLSPAVKSGLVAVPSGHGELLTGRGLASFGPTRSMVDRADPVKGKVECHGQKQLV